MSDSSYSCNFSELENVLKQCYRMYIGGYIFDLQVKMNFASLVKGRHKLLIDLITLKSSKIINKIKRKNIG